MLHCRLVVETRFYWVQILIALLYDDTSFCYRATLSRAHNTSSLIIYLHKIVYGSVNEMTKKEIPLKNGRVEKVISHRNFIL